MDVRGDVASRLFLPCRADDRLACPCLPQWTSDDLCALQWAKTTYAERRRVLRVMLDYIVTHQEEICSESVLDSGKTKIDAQFGEMLTTLEKLRWVLAEGEDALKPESRSSANSLMTMHKKAWVEFHPLGVLAVIAPWNYPFHNLFGHIVAGLFAGNAVVLKASEHTSWSSQYYQAICDAALEATGHSRDLVQIVTGFGETGAALVQADVDKIFFTGSGKVGKLVMRAAAERLTPVVMELGGKDPMILCEDCDFETVVHIAMRGTFQNCGQNCVGIERIYVLESLHDKFLAAVVDKVKALRQGAPLLEDVDCGSMVMPGEIERIQSLVDDAVAKGAKIVCGGRRNTSVAHKGGQYYEPTILTGVDHSMRITQEEVFGPIMVLMKAKNDADVVRLVNDCPFGLGSSVFSLDVARAERIASQIRAGMTNVNDFGINYLCQSLPFGGVKESGFDRFAGIEGLRGCCLMKSCTRDRVPFIRTSIPPPLQYPLRNNSFPFSTALFSLGYNRTLTGKLKAIWGLITNAKPHAEKKKTE